MIAAVLALVAQVAAPAATPDPSLAPYASEAGLVDVGHGRRINLRCAGTGRITVVLTAGAGSGATAWRSVQPEVAKRTRVCAWDRAGFGLSDPSAARQDVTATTGDLLHALHAARINGPLVLVGHSIGSYETLRAADRLGSRVRGIVLVDPSIPDQFRRFAAVAPQETASDTADLARGVAQMRRCAAGLRAGTVTPASDPDACLTPAPTTPPALAALLAPRLADPTRFDTQASFFSAMPASAEAIVRPNRRYAATPLIVLTAGADPRDAGTLGDDDEGRSRRLWTTAHDELAALSSAGVNRYVPDSSHLIPTERPQAVIGAIDELIDRIVR